MRNKKNISKILAIILLVFSFFCLGASQLTASAPHATKEPSALAAYALSLEVDTEAAESFGLAVSNHTFRERPRAPLMYSGEPDAHLAHWFQVLWRCQSRPTLGIPVVWLRPIPAAGITFRRQIGIIHGTVGHRPVDILAYAKNSFVLPGKPDTLMAQVWWFDENGGLQQVHVEDSFTPAIRFFPVIVLSRAPDAGDASPSA
ncbi:MAG: hypothetical protein NkDv07_0295 [Candidatus Improbicoccus devescovinae]|nr:MAG: hypothetical protein NkDv07_0295 [Candidatus Improbicoccus devescovinae]